MLPNVVEDLDRVFGLDAGEILTFEDARRGISRRIALRDGRISSVRLSGDTRSEPWLKDLWERGDAVGELRRHLLLPVPA
jgi:assimilatory nitrate reductase catalytic subunit